MTSKGLTLEEFDTRKPVTTGMPVSQSALAEAQLEAFDKGYREGWDDASQAHAADQETIGADLARALEDMSFTYHEARAAMLGEMQELLAGLVEKVLPQAMQGSLGAVILEQIESAVTARSEVAVEITVAPGNGAKIEPFLKNDAPIPVRLGEEPSLGAGQAVLRFASAEEMVDLDAVLAGVGEAVTGFFAVDGAPPKEMPEEG